MNAIIKKPVPAGVAPAAANDRGLWTKLAVFLVLVLGAALACIFIKPPVKLSEAGVVMQLPQEVLGFEGKDEPISEGERVLLPPDTEIVKKLYTSKGQERVNMEIVLSGVEHRSIHRPEICLRGQGWNVSGGQIVSVPLASGHKIDMMVLDITRQNLAPNGVSVTIPALYAYFFVSKEAETPRHWDRLAITNLDLLLHNKAHRWAYVIVMAPVTKGYMAKGKDRAQTLELIKDFLRATAPTFLKTEMSPGAAAANDSGSQAAGS